MKKLLLTNGYPSDLDLLSTYETAGAHVLATQIPVRYAVRQVLDQELQKAIALRATAAARARFSAGGPIDDIPVVKPHLHDDKENAGQKNKASTPAATLVKRDFFGRVVVEVPLYDTDGNKQAKDDEPVANQVWVTFHEGLNNAVKKPLTLEEFLRGF